MGRRFIRTVVSDGSLGIPVEVTRADALTTTITDHSWTFAESVKITVYVTGAKAEIEFYNGSSWSATSQPCYLGMNEFDGAVQGVRLRNYNGDAATATVDVSRQTA